MAMYGLIYFDGDKSLSVVSKSKCILRQSFEEGNEVEVAWKGRNGAKQIWLGVIVKIALTGKFLVFCYSVFNNFTVLAVVCRSL